MKILGISCYYHDSAAVLIDDGKIVAAAEEERFSRIKHDSGYPKKAIDFCLQVGGVSPKDINWVVFYEKPFLKFERLYQSVLNYVPHTYSLFKDATLSSFGDKLWVRSIIESKLGMESNKILFLPHHLSHAASTFLASPFPSSAILTIDGVGEWSTASIGIGNEKEIKIIKEMRFPSSLGFLYSVFTAFLCFEVNEGEDKVMGMAGYGKPKYVEKILQTVQIAPDGSLQPDSSYFYYHYHNRKAFSNKFTQLFGKSRLPKSPFDPVKKEDQYYADIAASIQRVTEETVLKMAKHAKEITHQENLCLAGRKMVKYSH